MKGLMIFLVAVLGLWGSSAQAADSGDKKLSYAHTVWADGDQACSVRADTTCFFGFTAADANSAVFHVPTTTAIACMDGDTGLAAAATTEVKFWRVVAAGTKAGSVFPSAASTASLTDSDGDCFTMVAGLWWIEIVSVQSGKTGLVTVTGRD